MKIKNQIITAAVVALAMFSPTVHALSKLPASKPEFMSQEQLAKWSADQKMAKLEVGKNAGNSTSSGAVQFYTGKPYDAGSGSYVFKYRSYDPELTRWTTSDPSGFPDGANNIAYLPNPLSQMDWQGLETISVNCDLPSFLGDSFQIERSYTATFSGGPSFTGPARLQGTVAGSGGANVVAGVTVSYTVSSPSVEFTNITPGPVVNTGGQTTRLWSFTANLEATVSLTFTGQAGIDLKPFGIGITIGANGSYTDNTTYTRTYNGTIQTVE